MKKQKIMIALALVLIVLTILGINELTPGLHPTEQPGTTWSTEDGAVTFHIPDHNAPLGTPTYGVINSNNDTINVAFAMSNLAGVVGAYTPEDYTKLQNGEVAFSFETWTEVSIKENRFVVRVTSTTYFNEGQELVFFKVE